MPGLSIVPGDVPQVLLYGDIGDPGWFGDPADAITDIAFAEALRSLGSPAKINLRINSLGGDTKHAFAMYNAITRHPAQFVGDVDHMAASCASLILMACDTINVAENGIVMIHKAWTSAMGNADEMQQVVDILNKYDGLLVETYSARTKQTSDKIKEWLAAETWFTASEAQQYGFADAVTQALKTPPPGVSSAAMRRFRNAPKPLAMTPPPPTSQAADSGISPAVVAARIASQRAARR